jgi:acetyl-CoA acetyltransferase
MIGQACATGAQCASTAAQAIEQGISDATLVVTTDRCSNGPHIAYASQTKPGATPDSEDWVWDNFGRDPWAKNAMIETAENVAKEANIPRSAQDEVALLRYQQYEKALADDRAFHKRYMMPVEVNPTGRKVVKVVEDDEGVFPTTAEGLAKLKPVLPNGSVTFGSQTHPADGNACMVVTTRDRAKAMSKDPKVEIQLISFGQARVKKGYMATAVVPAAREALERASVPIKDIKVITTHNPFAVNDIYFCNEMGTKVEDMNRYGSSMIWGHPQGPTGLRATIECIEELVMVGGGLGLFAGCAAGDTAGALVLKVDVG